MPFFDYHQNNSGGEFHHKDGLAKYVVIEADNFGDANRRAQDYGLYFDGVEDGRDCHCCGDRWYKQWEFNTGTDAPAVFGETDLWKVTADDFFREEGPSVVVVYKSGLREWFSHRDINPITYAYDLGDDDVIEDQLAIEA